MPILMRSGGKISPGVFPPMRTVLFFRAATMMSRESRRPRAAGRDPGDDGRAEIVHRAAMLAPLPAEAEDDRVEPVALGHAFGQLRRGAGGEVGREDSG